MRKFHKTNAHDFYDEHLLMLQITSKERYSAVGYVIKMVPVGFLCPN